MSARCIIGISIAIAGCSGESSAPTAGPPPVEAHQGNNLPTGKTTGSAAPEKPWLSPEATNRIVDKDGALGPAFAGVELGGPTPSDAVRAQLAELARVNDVGIDLEIAGGKLVAVRFAVTYGGCCGYEAADKLALRLQRPYVQAGDGAPKYWATDWATIHDQVNARVRVRVNRVDVRWERAPTFAGLLERVDALIGKDIASASEALGDRWRVIEAGHRYFVELPYPTEQPYLGTDVLEQRSDLGGVVLVEAGRIHEIKLGSVMNLGNEERPAANAALRARWGPPRTKDGYMTWRTATRSAAEVGQGLVIRAVP